MVERSQDPRKYHWIILSSQVSGLHNMLADAQFGRHSNIFGAAEAYYNSLDDVVTLVEGVVPGTYQVRCSEGCLSLLQDALGDPVPS